MTFTAFLRIIITDKVKILAVRKNSRAVLSVRGYKKYIGVDLLRVGKLSCYSEQILWAVVLHYSPFFYDVYKWI